MEIMLNWLTESDKLEENLFLMKQKEIYEINIKNVISKDFCEKFKIPTQGSYNGWNWEYFFFYENTKFYAEGNTWKGTIRITLDF